MPKSPILGGFSTQRSPNAADNEAINIIAEVIETKDGKVPGFLFLASGLDLVVTVGDGPIRGVLPLGNLLYVVSGQEVWSVTTGLVKTLCGTIGDQDTPVSMFQNTRQLMIVDGVGGWIVPGGYPLTGGTINLHGGLYAVNDTVTLQANSGVQTSYPIITITAIADNPITTYTLANAGTTYATASGVATTAIQPHPGGGSGLTINVTAAGAGITAATLGAGGTGYAVGDTGIITSGSRDAVYRVTGVSGGVVTTFVLLNRGTAYSTLATASTQAAPGIQNNLGVGFTLNITAAGPITASVLANGGHGYVIGAAGFVSGGTGDATYLVTGVGPTGSVIAFTITQPGAIDTPATLFSQRATSGSGSGLTLTSPSFGSFVGLIPVDLPFPNPIVGGISDGFGVLVFLGQQNVAASESLDLSTWPALSFGLANQSPDNTISLHVIHDEVFVLKTDNTEVWVDQGLPNFPFAPITSVHIETGCMAPFSPATVGEELVWLSRNNQGQGIVVAAKGYRVTTISTQAMTAEFDKYPNLGDAIGYARQEGGHEYYVLTFPEADKTWEYDQTASALVGYPLWHRLAAFDNGEFKRHWGNAWTPWRGSGTLAQTNSAYSPEAVKITDPTELDTLTGLNGLPISFSTAMFSVWLDLSDAAATGLIFSNQGAGATPGMEIVIQNDSTGTPQITVSAWDGDANPIVVATYNFATWTTWVNVMMAIDTANQDIEVYANTVISGLLVESRLTAASLTWSSSNPIAPAADHAWKVEVVT
ncbi:MAG TPA: hypothetical protein VNU68_35080 [Verrucomicrobiae bacterium]|nr:hypothetical protein [Verrucomicrobiae bacterium]